MGILYGAVISLFCLLSFVRGQDQELCQNFVLGRAKKYPERRYVIVNSYSNVAGCC